MRKSAIIVLAIVMVFLLPDVVKFAEATSGWSYFDIDTESSDVDGSANIGSAVGDFNDTQHFDEGSWENITEGYVDITQDAWYGRQVNLGGGFRGDFGQNFARADRKVFSWWNIPNDFTVDYLSFYGRVRYSGESWDCRMGIYNGTWSATDANAHPTNLIAETETVTVDYTEQYWNFTFTTPPTLRGGHRYWLGLHFDNAVTIWKSRLIRINYNKSAKCQDLFSDGLDSPFDDYDPHEWNKYGAVFDFSAYGNETVQNYQLDWEMQFQNVDPTYDYYQVQVYGYTTGEEVQIHVWDPPPDSEWDYWGEGYPYWKLNATPRWQVSTLFQHINETITIRFKGANEQASDQTADTLHIDAVFLYGYNASMDITDPVKLTMSEAYNPGDGLVEFDNSPVTVHIEVGQNWNLHYKGGTFTDPNWIWISNSSNPADAVPLIVWGISDPLFTENQARGDGEHDVNVWVFLYVPIPDPPDDYDGFYETYLELSLSTELIGDPIDPP